MADHPSPILLGRITGAHGIRGEVIVHSYAEVAEDIAAYGPLADQAGARAFSLKVVRVTPKGVIARIKGVDDRNAAEALAGTELYIARDKLPKPAVDEYYHADLIGLSAVSPEGKAIGHIVAVDNFGAGDLLEIRLEDSLRTEFVAFTDACVPQVDIKAGCVVVVMPESGDGDEDGDEDGDVDVDGDSGSDDDPGGGGKPSS